MMSERIQLRSYTYDDSGGRWRLTDHVVEYSKPWAALSSAAVFEEYKEDAYPWQMYMHHLIQRHEGEVAETWGHWSWEPGPLPRHAEFWNQQFASDQDNFERLGNLRSKQDSYGNWMVPETYDLTKVGNTTILRTEDGVIGHWQLNGGASTLAELFFKFGQHYTVSELMNWYYNARNI